MTKRDIKVKVPNDAPMVLVTINAMIRARRQELQALIESGQAYAKSVRLDPAKNYRFSAEGDKVYATETVQVQQGAEAQE